MSINCGDILECQLEESSSKDWSDVFETLEDEKEETQDRCGSIIADTLGDVSPRYVYCIDEGTMPALPENLISHVRISPSFSRTKSHSLQDEFSPISTSPNEYLMWKLKDENYLVDPIRWLIEKRIISVPDACRDHHGVSVFHDGMYISWCCGSCRSVHPVVFPSFYRMFENSSLSDLLAVTIHWACQSDLSSIMNDCKMDVDQIFQVWSQLQTICKNSLKKNKLVNCSKKNCTVLEGAVFQFGEFLIIGVLERYTRFSHLEAVLFKKGWNIDRLSSIIDPILKNCNLYSHFVSDCILFKNAVEKCNLTFVLPDEDISDPKDPGYHNLNIRHYIIRFLITNFSIFDSRTVHHSVLQAYLDELQWRERFGHTSQMAFWNMLYRIAREVTEASDTVPKRFEEETDLLCKAQFDSIYAYKVYEPPFPMLTTAKDNNNISDGSHCDIIEVSNMLCVQDQKDAEVILPSTEVQVETEASEMLSEHDAFPLNKEDSSSPVVIMENETAEASYENVPVADMDASSESSSSVPSENSSLEDVSGSVSFMAEGYITLTIFNLLSIQTWPFILTIKGFPVRSEGEAENSVLIFRKKLYEEGYFNTPIPWMVNHHLVHEYNLCDICSNDRFYLHEDPQIDGPDKFIWKCTNTLCSSMRPFKRLKFFTLFGFSSADILYLLYHWAAQTKIEDVRSVIQLNEYKIRYVYWAIQRICSRIIELQNPLLGGNDLVVEVGIVQFGQFCIVGAFDRVTSMTRFKTFPAPNTYKASLIESVVQQWLKPLSVVVTTYKKCMTFSNNKLTRMKNSCQKIEINTSLISRCLYLLVKNLFGKFSTSGLRIEMIQAFLDEIQWRERYGIVPEAAFWNLFYQIAQDDEIDVNYKQDGLPQICQVGAISAEMFTDSSVNSATAHVATSEKETEETTDEICSTEISESPTPSKSEEPVAAPNDNMKPSEQEKTVCNEMPFPGVTMLNEKELVFDSEDELEMKTNVKHSDSSLNLSKLVRTPATDIWDCSTLTLDWDALKVLRPVVRDCMSFLKQPQKLKQFAVKGSQEKFYALDEYYFARKKPTKISIPDRTYVYCCTLCKLYLFSNISVMEHTMLHADEKRHEDAYARNFVNCPFCFGEMHSKEALEQHVKEVHESKSSLSCIICSQLYPTIATLTAHMKFSHVPCEMPYSCAVCHFRSSLHKEVLDHFKEVHQYEPHLICPFCLKICSPRAKTDEVLYTQAYCQHIIKHQLSKHNSICPSCSLRFISPSDVQLHILRDHISFEKQPGVVPFKPRENPIVVTLQKLRENIVLPSIQLTPLQIQSLSVRKSEQSLIDQSTSCHAMDPSHSQSQSSSLLVELLQLPPTSCPSTKDTIPATTSSQSLPNSEISSTSKLHVGNVNSKMHHSEHLSLRSSKKTAVSVDNIDSITNKSLQISEELNDNRQNDFIRYNIGSKQSCVECGCKIGKQHFYKLLGCYCKFSTHCSRAFVAHMMNRHNISHKHSRKKMFHSKRKQLLKNCSCSCGFLSDNGDLLAHHLQKCAGIIYANSSIFFNNKLEVKVQNNSSDHSEIMKSKNAKISCESTCLFKEVPSNIVNQIKSGITELARDKMVYKAHNSSRETICSVSEVYGVSSHPTSHSLAPHKEIAHDSGFYHGSQGNFMYNSRPPPFSLPKTNFFPVNHHVKYLKSPVADAFMRSTRYIPYALPPRPRFLRREDTTMSRFEPVHPNSSIPGHSIFVDQRFNMYNSKGVVQNVVGGVLPLGFDVQGPIKNHAVSECDQSLYTTLNKMKMENMNAMKS